MAGVAGIFRRRALRAREPSDAQFADGARRVVRTRAGAAGVDVMLDAALLA